MKLLTGQVSVFAKKVEIAAYEKGIELDTEWVPFSLKERYTPKHPEVVRINPKQQVPIIIDGDLELFDSTLIFEYFEDIQPTPPLWPQNPKTRAQARLLELTSDEIIVGRLLDLVNPNKTLTDTQQEQVITSTHRQFAQLNQRIGDREFFFDHFTYADIAIYCCLTLASLLNVRAPKELSQLLNWRRRISERESVQRAIQPMFDYIAEQRVAS